MKTFILRLLLFISLFGGILAIGWFLPPSSMREAVHESAVMKDARLTSERMPGRIVIAGGSNAAFGIYSPLLSQALGRPVINTAIHGGYGLDFILRSLEPALQSQDVVLLLPEYANFLGDHQYGDIGLVRRLNATPDKFSLLKPAQLRTVLSTLTKHCGQKLYYALFGDSRNEGYGADYRKMFNEYGDVVGHWDFPARKIRARAFLGAYNPAALQQVESFTTKMQQGGVKVIMSYPAYSASSFELNKGTIEELEAAFTSSECTIIGTPETFRFPDDYFFDTAYHLHKAGQLERTSRLASLLKEYLSTSPVVEVE